MNAMQPVGDDIVRRNMTAAAGISASGTGQRTASRSPVEHLAVADTDRLIVRYLSFRPCAAAAEQNSHVRRMEKRDAAARPPNGGDADAGSEEQGERKRGRSSVSDP
ncbi:MAG: hypothetical protein C0429_09500 [Sphingopyxis sp.]|nr:hypothetical protein [Sphingopyxis sp.]